MGDWLTFLFNLFQAYCSLRSLPGSLRKVSGAPESPFKEVDVTAINDIFSSPLLIKPKKITRSFSFTREPGLHLITGFSGVGKTRETSDMAIELALTYGNSSIYIAKGYVSSFESLPAQGDIRRVVIMIDDYDLKFEQASSKFFVERQGAYEQALKNLGDLFNNLNAKIDLFALIVNINLHRLPVTAIEVKRILPNAFFHEIPSIEKHEHQKFLKSLSTSLELRFTPEALEIFNEACDGRFGNIAIFLSRFKSDTVITKNDAEEYRKYQQDIWKFFRNKLSKDQLNILNEVKILRDYSLTPRIEYVTSLLENRGMPVDQKTVGNIMSTMWKIKDSQPLFYDSQLGPREHCLEDVSRISEMALKIGKLHRFSNRYIFQKEIKCFCFIVRDLEQTSTYLKLLKKLNRWYPRDRFFAYLLAQLFGIKKRYWLAILTLYRIFRAPSLLEAYSGKWIEIHAHLLLAGLYQKIKSPNNRSIFSPHMIEQEFEIAVSLADLDIPDAKPEDFTEVCTIKAGEFATKEPMLMDGDILIPMPESKIDTHQVLENRIREWGYELPSNLLFNPKNDRALAHYRYAGFLLHQEHREYEAIRHYEITTSLIPDHGEAFINCSIMCNRIGDSQRALHFAEKAELATPRFLDTKVFEYMTSREKWHAYEGMGAIDKAKESYSHCSELALSETLHDKLKQEFRIASADHMRWERATQLARNRTKDFSKEFTYNFLPMKLEIILPPDWKIDREWIDFEDEIMAFIVMFTSQLTWDQTTKTPIDACIDMYYSRRPDDMTMNAQSFGMYWLETMKKDKKQKITWNLNTGPNNLGCATFCRWDFHISKPLPKCGIMIALELPDARIKFGLMCEEYGKNEFWPLLESVAERFLQQECFKTSE